MQNSSGIKDKVAVITGASSGIGEATALLLASAAKVVLGARGPNRIKLLAARIALTLPIREVLRSIWEFR